MNSKVLKIVNKSYLLNFKISLTYEESGKKIKKTKCKMKSDNQ